MEMKSSLFFYTRKDDVAKLVEIQDSGNWPGATCACPMKGGKHSNDCAAKVTWKRLEDHFGLDPNNGMSAFRVYGWAKGYKVPPAAKTEAELADDVIADAAAEVVAKAEPAQIVRGLKRIYNPPPKPRLPKHSMYSTVRKCIEAGIHVFMSGPAGGGKTFGAEMVAQDLGFRFFPMSIGSQTPQSQLIGYMNATGSYVRTIFREAFEHGGLFLLDEIDSGNPNVLTALNSALANQYCSFADGVVKRHPDFRCIAAGNTWGAGADRQYVGRNPIDAATLNRFAKVSWDYDNALELKISGNDKWTRRVQAIRKSVFRLKLRVLVTPRSSMRGATLLAQGISQTEVEDMEFFNEVDAETKRKILAEIPAEVETPSVVTPAAA